MLHREGFIRMIGIFDFRFSYFRLLLSAFGMAFASYNMLPAGAQQNPEGLAKPATAKARDALHLLPPASVQIGGLLGERFIRSEKNRLLRVDEEELLDGFRHRPGKHPWIGEHVGKWLHAATLAWANTGDPALRAKLDRVARELIKTQEPDGYLGTYAPAQRFGLYPGADWDVWSHKYCLIGLLTYYQYTGSKEALDACRRIGDLLINTFGPGRKSIISAGTHMGMAATSVLEPVVLLYRATGDARYLDFAKYIVGAWEEPGGPHILSSLRQYRSVRRVANAKAYEMLSNLAGLCELYRATGDRQYLDAVLIAWNDIAQNRLYITGSGSSGEVWQDDFHLPNGEGASICETCVTVSWEQLNLHLLRLLGEPRFADQLERTVYNHLLGAQKPTGDDWSYYTPLVGRKPYDSSTNCCHSSGPRGVALLPAYVYSTTADGVNVNLFTPSRATVPLSSGGSVRIVQQTQYPLDGTVNLTVTPQGGAKTFALRLRVPAWTPKASVAINGRAAQVAAKPGGWAVLQRTWKPGDRVTFDMEIPARLIPGDHGNAGLAAVMYGPIVLAADEAHNPGMKPITRAALAEDDPAKFKLRRDEGESAADVPVFTTEGRALTDISQPASLRLVPYYAAGQDGSRFAVWLRRAGAQEAAGSGSLLAFAEESRSRQGNQPGSITDDDPDSFCVTFDGGRQDEDWYAVTLEKPVTINRVVFAHGHIFHDGGWFDTSGGKPRVQVRRTKDGPWEDIATLDAYPVTDAVHPPDLRDGQKFSARFPAVMVWGVCISGKPACGDNPTQVFSSCGELQAFLDR
jgi:DUF1680 family protein